MRGHLRQRGDAWELCVFAGRKRYGTRTFRGPKRAAEDALARFVTEVAGMLPTARDVTVGEPGVGGPAMTSFMMSAWSVELEPEIEEWLGSLDTRQFAAAAARIDYLSEVGARIQMPRSRALGAELFELRFEMDRNAMRITFFFPGGRTHRPADGVPHAAADRAG
jgi:hypothetical protein